MHHIKTMKLPTDYDNLLQHVVDGFNRNFFRNEFKAKLKIIADSQKVLDTVDASGEEKFREMREHYLNRIKTAQASLEAIGKGLMEHLANLNERIDIEYKRMDLEELIEIVM